MPDYIYDWLNQTWIIVVAVISGVSLVWNFRKTIREITAEVKKPIAEINDKMTRSIEDSKLIKDALLASQRRELLDACEECFKEGYCTLERQQTLAELYGTYHALGGDNFVTDLLHRTVKLPVAPPETPKRRKIKNDQIVE